MLFHSQDVPDVAGDRKFNIPSFSVVLGETRLFAFARRLLTTLLWFTAASLGVGAKAAAEASLPWTAASRYVCVCMYDMYDMYVMYE